MDTQKRPGLEAAVLEALRGESGVLVALSGGADSVALLHACLAAAQSLPLRVAAAHLEHGIRGQASLDDMAFVENLCRACGVPLFVKRLPVPALAKGANLEQTARRLRYAFLEETRLAQGLSCLATAHHVDDQAETLLLHLTRGAALRGLTGMRPRSGVLLRPLLGTTRAEIEAYCRDNGLSFRVDETNADVRYARNRVRGEVLPSLRVLNPRVSLCMAHTAALLQEDEDLLTALALDHFSTLCAGETLRVLPGLPRPLWRRVLAQYLSSLGEENLDTEKLAALESVATRGGRATVGERLFEQSGGVLRPVHIIPPFCLTIPCPGVYTIEGIGCLTLSVEAAPASPRGGDGLQWFAPTLPFPLALRSWRPGDRLKPFGGGEARLLSDLFTNAKVPRSLRGRVPLLVEHPGSENENILWAVGLRRASAHPLTYSAHPLTNDNHPLTDGDQRAIRCAFQAEGDRAKE